jgi:hypothetical protein
MAESFSDEQTTSRFCIEFYGVPLTEGRGTYANVHYHVEDSPGKALNVLGLPGWNVREVDAAHCSLFRNRDVHLFEVERSAHRRFEDVGLEGLKEYAAIIGSKYRCEFPHAVD